MFGPNKEEAAAAGRDCDQVIRGNLYSPTSSDKNKTFEQLADSPTNTLLWSCFNELKNYQPSSNKATEQGKEDSILKQNLWIEALKGLLIGEKIDSTKEEVLQKHLSNQETDIPNKIEKYITKYSYIFQAALKTRQELAKDLITPTGKSAEELQPQLYENSEKMNDVQKERYRKLLRMISEKSKDVYSQNYLAEIPQVKACIKDFTEYSSKSNDEFRETLRDVLLGIINGNIFMEKHDVRSHAMNFIQENLENNFNLSSTSRIGTIIKEHRKVIDIAMSVLTENATLNLSDSASETTTAADETDDASSQQSDQQSNSETYAVTSETPSNVYVPTLSDGDSHKISSDAVPTGFSLKIATGHAVVISFESDEEDEDSASTNYLKDIDIEINTDAILNPKNSSEISDENPVEYSSLLSSSEESLGESLSNDVDTSTSNEIQKIAEDLSSTTNNAASDTTTATTEIDNASNAFSQELKQPTDNSAIPGENSLEPASLLDSPEKSSRKTFSKSIGTSTLEEIPGITADNSNQYSEPSDTTNTTASTTLNPNVKNITPTVDNQLKEIQDVVTTTERKKSSKQPESTLTLTLANLKKGQSDEHDNLTISVQDLRTFLTTYDTKKADEKSCCCFGFFKPANGSKTVRELRKFLANIPTNKTEVTLSEIRNADLIRRTQSTFDKSETTGTNKIIDDIIQKFKEAANKPIRNL